MARALPYRTDARVFVAATTGKELMLYDVRAAPSAPPPSSMVCESMINVRLVT